MMIRSMNKSEQVHSRDQPWARNFWTITSEKHTGCAEEDLLFIKIDIGIHLCHDGVDVKVHRKAAEQVPVPGIFIIKGSAEALAVILLGLVEYGISFVIIGPSDETIGNKGERISPVGISEL